MKIVLVNGPPRSGKDTVGEIIQNWLPSVELDKFARILKERTHALYGAVWTDTGTALTHNFFECTKEMPQPLFLGLSPRQAYIEVSERLMKHVHGNEVFGKLLLRELLEKHDHDGAPDVLVMTDSGFRPEAEVLIRHWGAENFVLLRLHRDGCDFSGDSRSYLKLDDLGVPADNVVNDGTLEDLGCEVQRILGDLL